MGDAGYAPRDSMQVKNADMGRGAAVEYQHGCESGIYQADIPVTVSDGLARPAIQRREASRYWVVNSLEIRPATTFIPVTFTSGPGRLFSADGLLTDDDQRYRRVP